MFAVTGTNCQSQAAIPCNFYLVPIVVPNNSSGMTSQNMGQFAMKDYTQQQDQYVDHYTQQQDCNTQKPLVSPPRTGGPYTNSVEHCNQQMQSNAPKQESVEHCNQQRQNQIHQAPVPVVSEKKKKQHKTKAKTHKSNQIMQCHEIEAVHQDMQLAERVITPTEAEQLRQEKCNTLESNSLNPLWKTRLCKFAPMGLCSRGDTCMYAHGTKELRKSPDFSRTSICPKLLKCGECNDAKCRYAHHRQELREVNDLLKTKMCRFHAHGGCFLGSRCRFAHGEHELGLEGASTNNAGETCMPVSDQLAYNTEEWRHGEVVDESSTTTSYQGMSPDNTPPSTPRACQSVSGTWMTAPPQGMHSNDGHSNLSDPPTPDPFVAWQMPQNQISIGNALSAVKVVYQNRN
jgi:hypothetical protein